MPNLSLITRKRMLTPPTGEIRVVIDTDTFNEVDDQFALVQLAMSLDNISLEAIYAAPFANARASTPGEGMRLSFEEILRILTLIQEPTNLSSPEHLVYEGVTEYVGVNRQARQAPAVDDLITRARTSSEDNPLYVIAIAAISNVSSAILQAPDIVDKLVVIWLGGHSLEWPDVDEFNLRQDVGGAQVLFDSKVPLVLVPCRGVTSHLSVTVPEIERYVEPCGSIGAFLASRFKTYRTEHMGWSKPLWDMAAVAWLLDPSSTPSRLVPTPYINDNLTWKIDESRHLMRYVWFVDRDRIFTDFYTKLEKLALEV